MTELVHFKLYYNGDIHRFSRPLLAEDQLMYDDVIKKVAAITGQDDPRLYEGPPLWFFAWSAEFLSHLIRDVKKNTMNPLKKRFVQLKVYNEYEEQLRKYLVGEYDYDQDKAMAEAAALHPPPHPKLIDPIVEELLRHLAAFEDHKTILSPELLDLLRAHCSPLLQLLQQAQPPQLPMMPPPQTFRFLSEIGSAMSALIVEADEPLHAMIMRWPVEKLSKLLLRDWLRRIARENAKIESLAPEALVGLLIVVAAGAVDTKWLRTVADDISYWISVDVDEELQMSEDEDFFEKYKSNSLRDGARFSTTDKAAGLLQQGLTRLAAALMSPVMQQKQPEQGSAAHEMLQKALQASHDNEESDDSDESFEEDLKTQSIGHLMNFALMMIGKLGGRVANNDEGIEKNDVESGLGEPVEKK